MSNEHPPQVAVVGCGYWGRNLVRNFHALGALRAIADADAQTAHGMAEQYGAAVTSVGEACTDPDVAGVVIATPAETHFTVARAAWLAGKHV